MTGMVPGEREQGRLLTEATDPIVRDVLACADPWDAYDAVGRLTARLTDGLGFPEELSNQAALYVTWSNLTDLFDAGKVPIEEAHAALRSAAAHWLKRRTALDESFVVEWLEKTDARFIQLVETYGDFWRQPGPASP